MPVRVVSPRGRSGLLIDAHPTGCERSVVEMADEVGAGISRRGRGPVALIIGSSAGYGLAITVAGIVGYNVSGVGLCFERPAAATRTASAGWYRIGSMAGLARERGRAFTFLNGDCFLDETKRRVLDELKTRFGQVNYLIYSVAAPLRTDNRTGSVYRSVIKPLGRPYVTKNLTFEEDGRPVLGNVEVPPATEAERLETVKVMGGEDWAAWVEALASEGLLADGFQTVALSYIGSDLTSEIYRRGTIGSAKEHLEQTAQTMTSTVLRDAGGFAATSVNGAAVTQASMAIPGVPLYISLLKSVLGEAVVSPVRQSVQLWDHLTGREQLPADEHGRLRLDGWELDPSVQMALRERWSSVGDSDPVPIEAAAWFRKQFFRLYGFGLSSVDYDAPVEVDVPWPEQQD